MHWRFCAGVRVLEADSDGLSRCPAMGCGQSYGLHMMPLSAQVVVGIPFSPPQVLGSRSVT